MRHTPRLRMFAVPNGSGKSTLKTVLPPELLFTYLNNDEIEDSIRAEGSLDVDAYIIGNEPDEILGFIAESPLIVNKGLSDQAKKLRFSDGRLFFDAVEVNGYYASAIAEYIRHKLLKHRFSFTFETVMSHPAKVELLKRAQSLGYRTYLYYIATDDPEINVARVRYRVSRGGHDVPEDKIRSRYDRSLELLISAIRNTNRAYIWDNSGHNTESSLLAEITEGRELKLKTSLIPAWFKKSVLDRVEKS